LLQNEWKIAIATPPMA